MRFVMSPGKAQEELASLLPDMANQISEDGSIEEVDANSLLNRDKLLGKPGEKSPTDGLLIKEQTSANESRLTGESKPVGKVEEHEGVAGIISKNQLWFQYYFQWNLEIANTALEARSIVMPRRREMR